MRTMLSRSPGPSNTPPPGWPKGEPYEPYIPSGPSTPGTDYDKNPTKNWYPNGKYQWDDPYLNGDALTRKERYPHYWSYGDPDPNWRPSFFGETPPWNRNPNDTTGSANTQKGDWFGNTMRDKPKLSPEQRAWEKQEYEREDAERAAAKQAYRDRTQQPTSSSGYPAQQGVSDMQTAPWNTNDSYNYGGPSGGGQYGEPPMPSYGGAMSGGKFHQGYGGPMEQIGYYDGRRGNPFGNMMGGGGGQYGGGGAPHASRIGYEAMGLPNPYQEQMKQQMQGFGQGGGAPHASYIGDELMAQEQMKQQMGAMGGGNARGQDFARIAQGFGQGGGAPMGFEQGFGGADMLRNMMMNRGAMGGGGGNPFQNMMGGMGGGGGNPFQNMMRGMGGGGGNPFQNMMGGMGGMGGGNPFMSMMGGGGGNPFMNMMRRY